MRIIKNLEESKDFWLLIFFSVIFFFLRLPSLFEPYWYGDEGIYQAIGLALRNGEILYKDVWDNKTPGIYYLNAFFGSDQFLTRGLSLGLGILGVILFFLLARKILVKSFAYRTATLFFTILFGLPLIEGNIANAENFMIPMIIACAYLVYSSQSKKINQYKKLILAGLILGFSFLFKIVSVFDFGAFFVFISIYDFPKRFSLEKLIRQFRLKLSILSIFTISFIAPFILSVFYFLLNHALGLYLSSIFLSNVDYVGYGNKFIIPQGLLILKLIILALALLIIFLKRNSIKFKSVLFILIWLSFSFFDVFFSQRNYPHYVLVIVPVFSLLWGSIFIYSKFSKVLTIILISSFIIIYHFFSFYWKNIQYYANFLKFVADGQSVYSYRVFFDKNTPRDYMISAYLKNNMGAQDKFFVWGNNAQLYKLNGQAPITKYIVAYHITQYKGGTSNMEYALTKTKPKFIVIMPNVQPAPFSLYNYQIKIDIGGALIYERII